MNADIFLKSGFAPPCVSVERWYCLMVGLGSLPTQAKSCDHEIFRAHKKCPKVVIRRPQNHVVWSRILKCSVKPYVTGPSTKCYFDEILFMWVLTHDKNRINQRLWTFRVPWSNDQGIFWTQSVETLEVVFKYGPSDHATWSIWWHIGIDFTYVLHSLLHWSLE